MWIINSGGRVEVTFLAFDLQSCADCGCDYVEVKDGPYVLSPLIGRYCGNRTEPLKVVSSDKYLLFTSGLTHPYLGDDSVLNTRLPPVSIHLCLYLTTRVSKR